MSLKDLHIILIIPAANLSAKASGYGIVGHRIAFDNSIQIAIFGSCALLLNMKRLARTCPLHEAAVYLTPLHVTDHLGSVRAVIGGKDGAVYAANDYSPYGTVSSILAAGSAPEPPGGVTLRDSFTGQESQTPDFGIPYVDFGARLYSPALRRWFDKIGEYATTAVNAIQAIIVYFDLFFKTD